MNSWLLDTNVISELRKTRCDASVRRWTESLAPETLYLSTITLAEIRFGIELQPNEAFRAELDAWLDESLRPWFSGRILEMDEDVILEWRRMVAHDRKQGVVFSQPDLFLAATAKCHDLALATRNSRDFVATGCRLFDPWTGLSNGPEVPT